MTPTDSRLAQGAGTPDALRGWVGRVHAGRLRGVGGGRHGAGRDLADHRDHAIRAELAALSLTGGSWRGREQHRAHHRPGPRIRRPGPRRDNVSDVTDNAIIYTHTDEAPLLATYSFLPIIQAYAGVAGVAVETRDISLAGRVIAQFARPAARGAADRRRAGRARRAGQAARGEHHQAAEHLRVGVRSSRR